MSEVAKPQNVAIRGDIHKRLKTNAAGFGVPLQDYVATCAVFAMRYMDAATGKPKALKMAGPKQP